MKMRYQTIGKTLPIALVLVFILATFDSPIKVNAAPLISPAVKVATDATNTSYSAGTWGSLGFMVYDCYENGFWFIWYPDVALSGELKYAYSADGISWTLGGVLFTPQNVVAYKQESVACLANSDGNTIGNGVTFGIGYIDTGTSPYVFYNSVKTNPLGTLTKTNTNDKGVTGTPGGVLVTLPMSFTYDFSGAFTISANNQAAGTTIYVYLNGAYDHSITVVGIGGGTYYSNWNCQQSVCLSPLNEALYQVPSTNNYVPNVVHLQTGFPIPSTSTHNTGGQPTLVNSYNGVNHPTLVFPYEQGTASNNGHCSIETFDESTGQFTNNPVSGQATTCGYFTVGTNAQQWAVSDASGQTIWLLWGNQGSGNAINQIVYTSNGGNAWLVSSYAPGPSDTLGFNGIIVNTLLNVKQALAVETDYAGNIWIQVFQDTVTSGVLQTQTVGSCPVKDTSTVKLANNTLYYYTATVTGIGETVNSVLGEVATVYNLGSTSFIVYEAVYATPGVGSVSVSNPLTLQSGGSHAFSVSPGSTNQALNFAPTMPSLTTGQTVAVALLGSDRFTMNQSTLAGMNKVTTSGLTLPGTITSTVSTATQLFLCATATYQSAIVVTITKTVTTGGGTSTQLINAPGPTQGTFWFLIIFYLLVPSVIFMLVASLPFIAGLRREGG